MNVWIVWRSAFHLPKTRFFKLGFKTLRWKGPTPATLSHKCPHVECKWSWIVMNMSCRGSTMRTAALPPLVTCLGSSCWWRPKNPKIYLSLWFDRGTGNHSSIRILQFLCRVGSYNFSCKSLNQFVSLCPCDNRYFWTYVQYVKVILFSWPDSCDTLESSSDSCRLDRRYISMIDEARWIVVLLFSITRIWTSWSFKMFVLQWRFAIIRRNQESSWLIWS